MNRKQLKDFDYYCLGRLVVALGKIRKWEPKGLQQTQDTDPPQSTLTLTGAGGQVSDMLTTVLLLCMAAGALGAGGAEGSMPLVPGSGLSRDVPGQVGAQCPSQCQCEEDGMFVMVDCSELGLSSVPSDLSPLSTYL